MKYKINLTKTHIEAAKNLSFTQKIDLLCCPNYMGDNQAVIPTGSAFFHADEKSKMADKIQKYKQLAGENSLVTTDMENGPGEMILGATEFPELFGISQIKDIQATYEIGKIAALEGREVGFNWTLGPSVDIAFNPDSPAVGARSAGTTVEDVLPTTISYIKGLQDNGMIATAKHFPGDGYCIYDQHLTTPENPLSETEWWANCGKVFQEVIDNGVMSIMPGHISLPFYDDPNPENGVYPPATLSPKLMKNLLRDKMGFDGIIVSDAVGMGGIVGYMNVYEACATFLEAGGDILLFPRIGEKFYEEMQKMLIRGVLTSESLINRCARVLAFKEDLVTRNFFNSALTYNKSEHEKTAEVATGRAIRVSRDRKNLIPQVTQSANSVLHLIISNKITKNEKHIHSLTQELNKHYSTVDEMENPGPDTIFDIAENKTYDLIVASIVSNYNFGTNVIRLHGDACRNLMQGWMHLETPVVFISHNHPFIEREYRASMNTLINTYGSTPYTAEHICKILKNHN